MPVKSGKLLSIKDVIRNLTEQSDGARCDGTIDALGAIGGNEPYEKETQLALEAALAALRRGAA